MVVNQTVDEATEALEKEGINISVYDIRFLKPIDNELLHTVLSNHETIITLENGSVVGGLGSAVSEFMTTHNYKNKLEILGIPDKFIEQGTVEELHKECGLDFEHILLHIRKLLPFF